MFQLKKRKRYRHQPPNCGPKPEGFGCWAALYDVDGEDSIFAVSEG